MAGPIRLQHGFPGPKGFGYRHVEAYDNRMQQLRNKGFRDFSAFVYDVAQNYDRIQIGNDNRLILIYPKSGFDLRIVLQEKSLAGLDFWTVITGIPSRVSRFPEIYRKVVQTGESEPTPNDAIRPRFATLSLPKTRSPGGKGP